MIIANDNLDLACSVVEKVAMDRAVVEVDDALAPSYMARLKHRERSSQAFWDTAAMAASHYSGMLPDPLRLKLGGLQPSQMLVYEEFEKVSVFVHDTMSKTEVLLSVHHLRTLRRRSPTPKRDLQIKLARARPLRMVWRRVAS